VVSVESRIEQVTVFAHGARIRRTSTLRMPVASTVRVVGLPVSVIDDTVRSEAEGAGVISSLRVGVEPPAGDARSEESPELRAARRRVQIAEAELDRLRSALEALTNGSIVAVDKTDEQPADWGAVVAARRALVSLRASREQALNQQYNVTNREHDEARRALEIAVERDRDAGSARVARLHEVRKFVDLEIAGATSGELTIRIEYQVAAARWAPSYVARLDGERAGVEIRAVVAQDSGEDWTGVGLRLSTAEPEQFTQLPELHPQKIGRRQHEPARRGFRPPPVGAEALYADYERTFPERAAAPLPKTATATGGFSDEVWDEGTSRAKEALSMTTPPLGAPAMPPAVISAMPRSSKAGGIAGAVAGAVAGVVAAPFALAAQAGAKKEVSIPTGGGGPGPGAPSAPPVPRLDYANLRMAPPSRADRGTLVPAPPVDDGTITTRVTASVAKIERLRLPPGHMDEWVHTYDYAFASDGTVDIASDGAWHSIALTSRSGTAKVRHVAVPREQADVFRVAEIANPFPGPLLPGPIDVYDRGQFLVTSEVDYTPPGAAVEVGLGVDPTIKIARNVEFHEEAAGMLRGALRLVHAISIDVENLSPRPIDLEVRERVPVTRDGDDDIEVTLGKIEPAWERWTPDAESPASSRLRGGYRWKLAVPATTKKRLRAGYEVKIAGKLELVGGNRREP